MYYELYRFFQNVLILNHSLIFILWIYTKAQSCLILLKIPWLQSQKSWVKEMEVSDAQVHLFCTTPCSRTGVASFDLSSKESSCSCSQQSPVKLPLLTKAVLLSLCPSLRISANSSPLPDSVSPDTADRQDLAFSPPWSISVDPFQSESLCVLNLVLISRHNWKNLPLM